jgi:hypothetical protein
VRYTPIKYLFMRCMLMNLALGPFYPRCVVAIPC